MHSLPNIYLSALLLKTMLPHLLCGSNQKQRSYLIPYFLLTPQIIGQPALSLIEYTPRQPLFSLPTDVALIQIITISHPDFYNNFFTNLPASTLAFSLTFILFTVVCKMFLNTASCHSCLAISHTSSVRHHVVLSDLTLLLPPSAQDTCQLTFCVPKIPASLQLLNHLLGCSCSGPSQMLLPMPEIAFSPVSTLPFFYERTVRQLPAMMQSIFWNLHCLIQ